MWTVKIKPNTLRDIDRRKDRHKQTPKKTRRRQRKSDHDLRTTGIAPTLPWLSVVYLDGKIKSNILRDTGREKQRQIQTPKKTRKM